LMPWSCFRFLRVDAQLRIEDADGVPASLALL
jgi:hypothetical protein